MSSDANLTWQSDEADDTFEDIFNTTNKHRRPGIVLRDAVTAELSVTLYSIIFVLSVCGNILVMLTLIREKRMRTITNMFLLNLALSDMLLSVLCMPFTLVATIVLRDFIFGEAMCILIRYFQAVSVGVSCYTLVAISLERYYAICQPLKSRRWQTLSHARKMILGIWTATLILMSPIAAFQRLVPIRKGGHACRELWPLALLDLSVDKAYSILLAVVLLFVPLMLMSVFYGLMGKKLWISSRKDYNSGPFHQSSSRHQHNSGRGPHKSNGCATSVQQSSALLNSSHHERDITNRKRVIRMLFVIVLQYFICWAPIYILNTWQSIDFRSVFRYISPTAKSLILLLAYTSSFIHPVTYCFMNQNFRRGFYSSFKCANVHSRTSSVPCKKSISEGGLSEIRKE